MTSLDEGDWSAVDTNETVLLDILTTGWSVLALILDSDTDEKRNLGTLKSR